MQFQVPQFIEVEDKIIGPLTLKQFAYIAVAGLLVFFSFFIFRTFLWIIVTALIGALAISLAFISINGRPLIVMLFAALRYLWQPKFYLWQRERTNIQLPELPNIERLPKEKTPQKPLQNLWLKMNTTTTAIEKRENPTTTFPIFKKPKEVIERFEVLKKQTGEREIYKRVDYR